MKRKIFSIMFAFVLVLSFSLIPAMPAMAATINVPADHATIQAAIDAASSGDTIMVAKGTYREYLHITTDHLTIIGAGMKKSIIDLDGLTPYWHYSGCSGSFASRAGVLITGYGSTDEFGNPDEVVEGVTFKGFTVKNAGLNPPVTATGTHTGADDAATLTDSSASWADDALVGQWVHNVSDKLIVIDISGNNPIRSYGLITDNDATTVTATLAGGLDNDWDNGDTYVVMPYEEYVDVAEDLQDDVRGIGIGNGKDISILYCKVINSGYGGITAGYARCVSTHKYSEGVTIDHCIVSDHPSTGISIGAYVGPVTITNNVCSNNGSPHPTDPSREYRGTGIYLKGTSSSTTITGVISGNECHNNGFIGISLYHWIDGVTVENNVVTGHNYDQDGAGIFFYSSSNYPERCTNVTVRNNTVTGNIRGIIAYFAQESTIEGNIVTVDSGAFAPGQEGIKIDGSNNILVKGNTIKGDDGTGMRVQNAWNGKEAYANEIVDNTITNMGFPGIKVNSNAHDNTFTGNTISGAKFAGVFIYSGAHDNTFTYNTITGTNTKTLYEGADYEETEGDGVFLWGYNNLFDVRAGPGNVFHHNNICCNADDGMENQTGTTVDAENNWWGDASGPGGVGPGTGDAVSANVDFDPWLTAFCPPLPMSKFVIDHAKLDFKKKPDDDKVRLQGKLELNLCCGDGVSISEDVTVTVGLLSETITMVEKGKKGEKWEYKRPKGGTGDIKHMTINWKNGKFDIRMDKADLTGVTNPVTISIQIGDDFAEQTILMREKKHHWDYKD